MQIKHDIEQPKITDHDVLIRVKAAGVNPIDNITLSGTRDVKPLPHIPGSETSGEIEKIGKHVSRLKGEELLFTTGFSMEHVICV